MRLSNSTSVHVVVDNVGVGPVAAIAALQLADWKWMLKVNLLGVIHGVPAFLPLLRKNSDGGHIVSTASVGGLAAMLNLGAYAVSKFRIVALAESLAQELAAEQSPIGVSVLVPGTVRTNIARSSCNRPADLGARALVDVDLEDGPDLGIRWLDPDDVGSRVIDGMAAGELYIVTHPAVWPVVEARHQAIAATFEAQSAHL